MRLGKFYGDFLTNLTLEFGFKLMQILRSTSATAIVYNVNLSLAVVDAGRKMNANDRCQRRRLLASL